MMGVRDVFDAIGPRLDREEDARFWTALPDLELASLDPSARAWLAARWARTAQLEHASIASFSKFALQLVAVAAPPQLLVQCHSAAVDEVHHGRIAFALASRFAGRALGPGPLPLAGDLLGELSLRAIAVEAATDGCVNETLAAAEAAAAAEDARAPAIEQALRIVARDEERHAGLAWAFVGWASAMGGSAVLDPVRTAIADACRAQLEADDAPMPAGARGYGALPPELAREVRRRAVERLVLPGAAAFR